MFFNDFRFFKLFLTVLCFFIFSGRCLAADENSLNAEQASLKQELSNLQQWKKKTRIAYDKFVKKNNITEWPRTDNLYVNPFIYKNKTIGIILHFEEMLSSSEGLFEKGDLFVVRGVAPENFPKKGKLSIMAVKVLDKKEMQFPFVGQVRVPILKLLSLYKCKYPKCDDILFWQRADSEIQHTVRKIAATVRKIAAIERNKSILVKKRQKEEIKGKERAAFSLYQSARNHYEIKAWKQAIALLKEAIETAYLSKKNIPLAYNLAAWIMAACPVSEIRNGKEAVSYASIAVNIAKASGSSKLASFLDTLAAAYAEAGDFQKAILTQKEAIRKRRYPESVFTEHLKLYQQQKPVRIK